MNGVVVSRIHSHNKRAVTQPTLPKINEKNPLQTTEINMTLSTNGASMSCQCRRWWVNSVSTCDIGWKQDETALCGIPWWLGRATRLWIGGGGFWDRRVHLGGVGSITNPSTPALPMRIMDSSASKETSLTPWDIQLMLASLWLTVCNVGQTINQPHDKHVTLNVVLMLVQRLRH